MAKQKQAKKQPARAEKKSEEGIKVITVNRQAYHDYTVERTIEAGISLVGTEIKSIRDGKVNLRSSYAIIRQGEVWLENAHIATYDFGNVYNHDPLRRRKLLLHRREIDQAIGKVQRDGYTLVPTALYWKGNKVKAELALARGKQTHDKREVEKERDWNREKQRLLRRNNKDA